MRNSAAARLFGLSLSSAKRNATIVHRGASLAPRKDGGRLPKADTTTTRKLLEEDVTEERPPATTVYDRWRFLQCTTGRSMSLSTVKRLLTEEGLKPKMNCGDDGTRRVAESCLEVYGLGEGGGRAASGFRGREIGANQSLFCFACLIAS